VSDEEINDDLSLLRSPWLDPICKTLHSKRLLSIRCAVLVEAIVETHEGAGRRSEDKEERGAVPVVDDVDVEDDVVELGVVLRVQNELQHRGVAFLADDVKESVAMPVLFVFPERGGEGGMEGGVRDRASKSRAAGRPVNCSKITNNLIAELSHAALSHNISNLRQF
jgi:hypothetical protein